MEPNKQQLNPPIGLLVSNLGTPDAPTASAVRRYLREFLSDRRVIEVSPWLWYPILYGLILPLRPRRSAQAYREVWTQAGSPLMVFSQNLVTALQQRLQRTALVNNPTSDVEVVLAMRYGRPSIAAGLQALKERGVRQLIVLPLYPQFSSTTTASTIDAVRHQLKQLSFDAELKVVRSYHDQPAYIDALTSLINQHWASHPPSERLLCSFHGVPAHYQDAPDYRAQCLQTADALAAGLGLDASRFGASFQSRFGPRDWVAPYTEQTLIDWAQAGVKTVDICCPGFAVDCLETLEEIKLRARDTFINAGGESLTYIPALNDTQLHVEALMTIVDHALEQPAT